MGINYGTVRYVKINYWSGYYSTKGDKNSQRTPKIIERNKEILKRIGAGERQIEISRSMGLSYNIIKNVKLKYYDGTYNYKGGPAGDDHPKRTPEIIERNKEIMLLSNKGYMPKEISEIMKIPLHIVKNTKYKHKHAS